MRTEKPSDRLRELFLAAYVENQEQTVKEEELKRFVNPYITIRTVRRGEVIIRPADKLQSIIFVVKGAAHFYRVSAGGNMNMIGAATAPFFIGVTQMVSSDKEYYSQIVAAKNCLLVYIDAKYFLKCIREDGEAALVVIRDISKVVERNHARMNRMVFLKASNNLMVYIDRKWMEYEKDGREQSLRIKEQHSVIAADLGVSVRTLYRSINRLREDGLLTVLKGGILAVDESQIKEIRNRLQEIGDM